MDIKDLQPDSNGQFSVCMPTEMCPTLNKMELMAIFNQAGSVKRANITDQPLRNIFMNYMSGKRVAYPGTLLYIADHTYTKINWVFIRYASKDEIARALKLFGRDYNLRVARSSKKELAKMGKLEDAQVQTDGLITNHKSVTDLLNEPEDSPKKDQGNPDQNHQTKEKLNSSRLGSKVINSEVPVRNSKVPITNNSPPSSLTNDVNQDSRNIKYDRLRGGTKLFNNTKDELHCHKYGIQANSDQAISRLSIFVSNIESKEDFNELIKPYEPKSVVIKGNELNMFAFVDLANEALARRAIDDLDRKKQRTKPLKAQFQRVNRKHGEKREASKGKGYLTNDTQKSRSSPEMPLLETIYANMPALVHESNIGNDLEKYQLNCCIFVANFPTCSLESTLRKTFEKFHVLDICMINNQPGSCTKAFLYLATIYDVIAAVSEMNSSCILGLPMKVAVPFKNGIVNFLLARLLK